MQEQLEHDPDADLKARLLVDTVFYAKHHLKIRDVHGKMVPLIPNAPQMRFDSLLEEQRVAGQPMRCIVLKARKHGISTWVQAKMSQRYMQLSHHDAVVVAQDTNTAGTLFRMGDRMHKYFPTNSLVPKLPRSKGGQRAGKRLELVNESSLLVDTANNLSAGAGGTPLSVHLSELALYPDAESKMTALGNAVPDVSESMVVIESTARGENYFKELWDAAENGELAGYQHLFIPWFEHPDYEAPFLNEGERDEFEKTLGDGPLREDEPQAVELMEGQGFARDLILRKLNWRYRKIRSAEIKSNLKTWRQEYPSTSAEAFIVSGSKVFAVHLTSKVVERCKFTDPQAERGILTEGSVRKMRSVRTGKVIEVPNSALWAPEAAMGSEALKWKVWQHPVRAGHKVRHEDGTETEIAEDAQYVVSVDPASDDELVDGEDSAFHAIQVLDHRTLRQVAVYRARQDSDLAARQAFLAALHWNRAWICAEITGGYGRSMVATWKHDFSYPFVYKRRKPDDEDPGESSLLGFDTNRRTKPLLIDGVKELLRQEITGLRDLTTALEMRDLVRLQNGRVAPPSKKYSDCFMAWAIGQEICQEIPVKRGSTNKPKRHKPYMPRDPIGGY